MIVWRPQEKSEYLRYNLRESIKLAIDTSYRAAI